MAHHTWGDEHFDWESLHKACSFFSKLTTWARLCIHTKEKYGTMRIEYFGMGHRGIYGLLNPGDLCFRWGGPKVTIKFPKNVRHLVKLERTPVLLSYLFNRFTYKIAKKTGLGYVFWLYQKLVFNIFTVIAVKRWPHIKDEILHEDCFDDLLYKRTKKYIGYVNKWR